MSSRKVRWVHGPRNSALYDLEAGRLRGWGKGLAEQLPMPSLPMRFEAAEGLEFLWLELTARCNLACRHCYAGAGPGGGDRLGAEQWEGLLTEAMELGCARVQFTGGEPLLSPDLVRLVRAARARSYELIEVFTNATLLDEGTLGDLADQGGKLAVSFYSHRPEVHERITGSAGSFAGTVRGIQGAVAHGVPLRVGVIQMEENRSHFEETVRFLEGLGVKRDQVCADRVRPMGRGRAVHAPVAASHPSGLPWGMGEDLLRGR